MNPLIKTKVEAYQNEAIRIRRYLHQHPELSAKEYQTQQFIIDELNKHHIQCEKIADTGVVALVKGTKSGPQRTLLMRADLDALPINETTNVDFKSLNAGVMHACGHDGHMTNLLIAAFILNDLRDQFSGSVKFMFQPAEEAIGGCERMIKAGILENPHVDGAIGFHVDADHDVGEVSTKIGEWWAAPDLFTINIIGFGGHGAIPQKTVDPINIAAQFITAAQNIITRKIDPADPVVISFCSIKGGDVFNAIPNNVEIKGTIRTFSKENRQFVKEQVELFLKHICAMNQAKYTFDYLPYYPSLINNEMMVNWLREAALKVVKPEQFWFDPKVKMVGEDFSYLNDYVPSVFFQVGVHRPGEPLYSLHNPNFIFHEEDLFPIVTPIFIEFALAFLNAQ